MRLGNNVTNDALDQTQIDLLVSLDDGAGHVLIEIVGEYFIEAEELHDQIVTAVASYQAPDVQRAAHTLKGASVNVGANGLAATCALLEAWAVSGTAGDREALIESFEGEYMRALKALRALTEGG